MASDQHKKPWATISRKEIFRCSHYTLQHDRFVLPTGKEHDYFFVHTNGSALCVVRDKQGKFALVRQYRYIMQRESLEFPCGAVKEGEEPAAAAQREFEEETGHAMGIEKHIGFFCPFNGVTDEFCHVYTGHVTGAATGQHHNEEEEYTTVEWYTPQEIDRMIKNHTLWDGMTLAAWQLFKLQQ